MKISITIFTIFFIQLFYEKKIDTVEKLIGNYLFPIMACTEKFNISYYLYLTQKEPLHENFHSTLKEEYTYDNENTKKLLKRVEDTYSCLLPYLENSNLKISKKNIKVLISNTIECLKEDIENVTKLVKAISNEKEIVNFSTLNIKRLKNLLQIVDWV